MLFPGIHLENHGVVPLDGIVVLSKMEIAGYNLVDREDGKFNIVAGLVIAKGSAILLVAFPAELRSQIEVEYSEVIRLRVDQQVPRGYIPVNNA
jgi:hypothetical protein